MNKRVTLKDIAQATGVHVSTVSRALDPNRGTPLTEDVVTRIRETATKLGYRPNRIAYGLRTQKTMTIGVLLPDITNNIFPPIVRGIESVMEPLGYASIIVNTDSDADRERRLVDTLLERGVDGVLHIAAQLDDPAIVQAARLGVPFVTLNRSVEQADIPSVINDEKGGIFAAFEHLFAAGHRKIAHLAGPLSLSTGRTRYDAFRLAARKMGCDLDEMAIVESERYDEDEGRRCAELIIGSQRETTAILCANDRLALGAVDYLRRIGMRCPRDISITGFNDMPFLDMIPPALTTVRIQQFSAGAIAATHLAALIRGEADKVPKETILPVTLVDRDSVGPPRSDDAPADAWSVEFDDLD